MFAACDTGGLERRRARPGKRATTENEDQDCVMNFKVQKSMQAHHEVIRGFLLAAPLWL